MNFQYDMRLTIRDMFDKQLIIKQFYIEDLVFNNPVSSGDKIVLPHFAKKYQSNNPTFWCKVEGVNHSPEPASRSYIDAEYSSGDANFDSISKFLLKNYTCKDIL